MHRRAAHEKAQGQACPHTNPTLRLVGCGPCAASQLFPSIASQMHAVQFKIRQMGAAVQEVAAWFCQILPLGHNACYRAEKL